MEFASTRAGANIAVFKKCKVGLTYLYILGQNQLEEG